MNHIAHSIDYGDDDVYNEDTIQESIFVFLINGGAKNFMFWKTFLALLYGNFIKKRRKKIEGWRHGLPWTLLKMPTQDKEKKVLFARKENINWGKIQFEY